MKTSWRIGLRYVLIGGLIGLMSFDVSAACRGSRRRSVCCDPCPVSNGLCVPAWPALPTCPPPVCPERCDPAVVEGSHEFSADPPAVTPGTQQMPTPAPAPGPAPTPGPAPGGPGGRGENDPQGRGDNEAVIRPAPVPEPKPEPAPEPEPAPQPKPAPAPKPAPIPEPVDEPQPEVKKPEPKPVDPPQPKPNPDDAKPVDPDNDPFAPGPKPPEKKPAPPAEDDPFGAPPARPEPKPEPKPEPVVDPAPEEPVAEPKPEEKKPDDKKPAEDDPFADPFKISTEGSLPMRVWVDDSGEHRVFARLIEIQHGKVRLLKDTGKTTTVPLDRLGKADREYVDAARQKFGAGMIGRVAAR